MSFTTGGILFMSIAWIIIIGLCAYCMVKVLRKNSGHQNPPE